MASKQFYYVVVGIINEAGQPEFEFDPYTEEARFREGTVWNDEDVRWEACDSPENDATSEYLTATLREMIWSQE